MATRNGTRSCDFPRRNVRSLSRPSTVFRIADDPRNTQEHLIEKRDVGVGEYANDLRLHHAFAKLPQVDRTEDFRGLGEAAQQVLEVAGLKRPARRGGRPGSLRSPEAR